VTLKGIIVFFLYLCCSLCCMSLFSA